MLALQTLQVEEQPLQVPLGERFAVPKHDKQLLLEGPLQVRQELSHFWHAKPMR